MESTYLNMRAPHMPREKLVGGYLATCIFYIRGREGREPEGFEGGDRGRGKGTSARYRPSAWTNPKKKKKNAT